MPWLSSIDPKARDPRRRHAQLQTQSGPEGPDVDIGGLERGRIVQVPIAGRAEDVGVASPPTGRANGRSRASSRRSTTPLSTLLSPWAEAGETSAIVQRYLRRRRQRAFERFLADGDAAEAVPRARTDR